MASLHFEVVGLRVTDFDRALRFYTRVLGLEVATRGDTRSWGGGLWARLRDRRSHRQVELNWYPPDSLFGGRYSVGAGVDHLDFTIGARPRAQLERTYRRLLAHGARPTSYSPATTGGWMASVLDPDGIWITVTRQPTASDRRQMAAARAKSRQNPQRR